LESDLAYSTNIKKIVLQLRKEGHSAEEIVDVLENLTIAKSAHIPDALRQIADNASTPFGVADWNQLKGSPPSAKTIRRWEGESRSLSNRTSKADNTERQRKSTSPKKKAAVKVNTQTSALDKKPQAEATSGSRALEIVPADDPKPGIEDNQTDITSQSPDVSFKAVSNPQHDITDAEMAIKPLTEEILNNMFAGGPCLAPPDGIDVMTLRSWGVPSKRAAGILFEWRKWHRNRRHDICRVFYSFRDDLTIRNIGFKPAEVALNAAIWATEFHVQSFLRDIEIGRKYRHWENPNNHAEFLKEVVELSKPDPAFADKKRKHLEEVRQLLEVFITQIESALSKNDTYMKFEIEDTPFINQAGSTHAWEVSFDLWGYIHLRMQYDQLHDKVDQVNTKELQSLKKRMIISLKKVHSTLKEALDKRTYRQGFCSECPKEIDIS
jgi:hypothetical protein